MVHLTCFGRHVRFHAQIRRVYGVSGTRLCRKRWCKREIRGTVVPMTTDHNGVSTGSTTARRVPAKARRAVSLGSAFALTSTLLVGVSATTVIAPAAAEELAGTTVSTVDAPAPAPTASASAAPTESTPGTSAAPAPATVAPPAVAAVLTAREAALQRASRAGLAAGSFRSKSYGIAYAREWSAYRYKWSETQVICLTSLWNSESSWRWNAKNRRTGAYGIAQALPGNKMAVEGKDWKTNPETQIRWGIRYIASRHGTPCKALSFKRSKGWY